MKVARTVYRGSYKGLADTRGEFLDWITNGHAAAPDRYQPPKTTHLQSLAETQFPRSYGPWCGGYYPCRIRCSAISYKLAPEVGFVGASRCFSGICDE